MEEGTGRNPKTLVEEEEEDDDDDEGPPPGFDTIAINLQLEKMDVEDGGGEGEEDEDDDGPPPGFAEPHSPATAPPQLQPSSHSDTQRIRNEGLSDIEIERKQNETIYEEDRSPLGWQSISPKQHHPSTTPTELLSDVRMGSNQEEDDGPLPGWQWNPQQQPPPESVPPSVPQSAPSSNIQTEVSQEDDDGPPPGWQLISSQPQPPQAITPSPPQPVAHSYIEKENKGENEGEIEWHQLGSESSHIPEHSTTPTPQPQSSSSVASSDIEVATKQGPQGIKNEEKKLRTERGPVQRMVSRLPPSALSNSSEVGQLVCGTCRQLLSYPRGAKWVQCSACQTVNLALEAHQVGQVKCGGCTVLLMYPYGAPSVKCSSCHFVTRLTANNRRPHLAAQQAQRQRPTHQAH